MFKNYLGGIMIKKWSVFLVKFCIERIELFIRVMPVKY